MILRWEKFDSKMISFSGKLQVPSGSDFVIQDQEALRQKLSKQFARRLIWNLMSCPLFQSPVKNKREGLMFIVALINCEYSAIVILKFFSFPNKTNMKKILLFIAILMLPLSAQAATMSSDAVLAKDKIINDNYYVAAGNPTILGTVNGDLWLAEMF